ncbi:MAG: iron complex outermembrane receptor protein [Gammaproteobacteria bacterium]|jgi:iron complex outermembrane receptor protein
MIKRKNVSLAVSAATAVLAVVGSSSSIAQEGQRQSTVSLLLEEVVVTARKTEESMQDIPVAVSAMNSQQIDALKIRNIHDLSIGIPGVMLEDVGTQKNTANFSVRGVGMRGSIPSFDPAVGLFIDGIYMGLSNGVMMDTFDLKSVEVLRGPQGTLFGRNTTGGAVLINSKTPSDEFEANIRVAADGNPNGDGGLSTYVMGAVTGPLTDTLSARLVVYSNEDDGWFVNEFDGEDTGASETQMLRTSLLWTPTDDFDLTLRYEYQDTEGDGPVSQSHTNGSGVPGSSLNWDRDSHKFSSDERGFQDSNLDFVTVEANWDVDFGEGAITYIVGWRDYEFEGKGDIDSQPVQLFHSTSEIEYEQFSNEVRYSGTFDQLSVTTGIAQFSNELHYGEARELLGGALTQHGGGVQEVDSISWFGSLDYELTDQLTLNAGINVTREEKDVDVASLVFNVNSPCSIVDGSCPIDFSGDKSWTNVSPRLGLSYTMEDDTLLYGHWSRGYRSGIYNLRNTNADAINFGPGPTDPEKVDSFEIGFKKDLNSIGRINGAIYYTQMQDAQRAILESDPNSGIVQTFRNAGDIEIFGAEVEAQIALSDNLLLNASAGYIDASYDSVTGDLNGDADIDGRDKALEITSVPEWTYSVGLVHDMELGDWELSSRITYAYRDKIYTSDNNLGFIDDWANVQAGADLMSSDGSWILSLYGKNLLNEVVFGGDTGLPSTIGPVPLGGTFAPLQKGRVIGLQVEYNFN